MAMQRRCQTLVPLSWPPNQEMAPTVQGVCSTGKITAGILSPHVNDASGASYQWRRWWGRRGR
eukprot:1120714-Ditylum_brightwellii.AAC.1